MLNKNRIFKLALVLILIYFGLTFFDYYYEMTDSKIMEKTLLLTFLVTFVNILYPTL